jgi:Fic family protein
LFGWHAAIFPLGYAGTTRIPVARWRDDASGPMQVVSGPFGHERVHFEAPAATRVPAEMDAFLAWFEGSAALDPVLKAGLAHLWFVTVHPFADGNGRIARAIADLQLARAEGSDQRFYSLSSQIRADRAAYYRVLERTQRQSHLDVTTWLAWFLACLGRALAASEIGVARALARQQFWQDHAGIALNERQRRMVERLLEGFEGKLTTSKWAALEHCSQDSALRDIQGLIEAGILVRDPAGGRSTGYSLR